LQVSGVSDFFGSGFDGVLLLLSRLRLLDWFGDQLVGDFGFSVYTNKICYAKVKTVQRNDARHSGCKTPIKRKKRLDNDLLKIQNTTSNQNQIFSRVTYFDPTARTKVKLKPSQN